MKEQLKVAQLIHIAMMMGILFFTGVVIFLFLQNRTSPPSPPPEAHTLLFLMSIVHAMLFVSMRLASQVIRKKLENAFVPLPAKGKSPQEVAFIRWNTTAIMRLAFIEAPAIVGLITCLLGVMNGAIYQYPLFWLNLVGVLLAIVDILRAFPTEALINTLDAKASNVPPVIS